MNSHCGSFIYTIWLLFVIHFSFFPGPKSSFGLNTELLFKLILFAVQVATYSHTYDFFSNFENSGYIHWAKATHHKIILYLFGSKIFSII